MKSPKNIEIVLAAIVFCAVFALALSVHTSYPEDVRFIREPMKALHLNSSYPYPLHGDEWAHLAKARYTIETGTLANVNPYHSGLARLVNFESGFDTFLSGFVSFGAVTAKSYYLLPPLFSALAALVVFSFAFKITKNVFASFFSALFFGSIGSNINLLGFWFFLPVTLGITLLLGYFLFERHQIGFRILTFSALAIVYPLFCPLILACEAYARRKDRAAVSVIAAIFVLGFMAVYVIAGWDTLISYLISKKGWTENFEFVYNPFSYFGYLSSALAIIGAAFLLKRKEIFTTRIIVAYSSLNVLLFSILGFTIIIPYQRSFLLLMVMMSVMAGFGLYVLMHNLNKYFAKLRKKWKYAAITVVFLAVFAFAYHDYYSIPNEQFIPILFIDNEQYNALSRLDEKVSSNEVVMNPPGVSFAVYPVAGARTVALAGSNLGFGDHLDLVKFYQQDCKSKLSYIEKFNVSYVLSYDKLNCNFLDQVSTDGFWTYKVKR